MGGTRCNRPSRCGIAPVTLSDCPSKSLLALRNAVCNDRWEESWAVIEGEQRRQMSVRRQARCRTRAVARAAAAPAEAPLPEPPVRRRVRPLEPEVQSAHPWTFAWSVRRQRELADQR